jgi:heme-degrading monooxygenase HmoA
MYSRVTLLEIDTVRAALGDTVRLFEDEVVPALREQDGYEGVLALTTPDGKGMIVTFWESEAAASATAGFAAGALERHMMLFKSPPGREQYEVAFAELHGVGVT